MSAPTMVNDSFLRSGSEFRLPNNAAPDARRWGKPTATIKSRNARLTEFHNTMLAAFTPEKAMSKAAKNHTNTSQTTVNVDYLRSGREFTSPGYPTATPVASGRSRHARLEEFYRRTLQACSSDRARASTDTRTQPSVLLNPKFLQSGQQFLPSTVDDGVKELQPSGRTRHARLEDFYNRTLLACAPSPLPSAMQSEEAAAAINLDFLRSGQEFQPPTANSPEVKRYDGFQRSGKSRNARLSKFHDAMLSAYANAKLGNHDVECSKENRTLGAKEGGSASLRRQSSGPITPVNLEFLRSGQEFNDTNSVVEPARRFDHFERKGRHARLEQFYNRMLQQHSPA